MTDSISLWDKKCIRCSQIKPLDRFGRGRNVCKECRRQPAPPKPVYENAHKCACCQQIKPLEDFSPGTIAPYGVSSYCKACHNEKYARKPAQVSSDVSEKECSQCHAVLPLDQFHRNSLAKDGHQSACKDCYTQRRDAKYTRRPVVKRAPYIPDFKECSRCHEMKAIEEFGASRTTADRHNAWCKPCTRDYAKENPRPYNPSMERKSFLRTRYGITEEHYQAMYEAQGGVCAICKKGQHSHRYENGHSQRMLAVDHDHATGRVRDLLCTKCNQAFGMMDEDPELIRALLDYAQKWKGGG